LGTESEPVTYEPNVNEKAYGKTFADALKQNWNKVPQPEPVSIPRYYTGKPIEGGPMKGEPTSFEPDVTGKAYGKVKTIGDVIGKRLNQKPAGPELQRDYIPEGGIRMGEKNSDIPKLERDPYVDIGIKAYPESHQPIGMRIKAYLQENPDMFTNVWFRPNAKISEINYKSGLGRAGSAKYDSGAIPSMKMPAMPNVPTGRVSGTKTVGGRETKALSREPSLRSQGISERSSPGGKSIQIGRRADFRGQPASEKMKPMDLSRIKKAAGMGILSEQLPQIEGMIEGRSRQSNQMFGGAPSLRQYGGASVRNVEPQFEFGQDSRSRQEQAAGIAMLSKAAQFQSSRPTQRQMQDQQRPMSEIMSEINRQQGVTPFSKIGQDINQQQNNQIRSAQDQTSRQSTDQRTKYDQRQDFRQILDQANDQKFDQKFEQIKIPVPAALPSLSGLGAPSYGSPRGGRRFVERLSFLYSAGVKAPRVSAKPKKKTAKTPRRKTTR
jgi:hypothetical protein